ncbi:MAG: WD40 repeat domain-containing protein, partial [Candidatus Zixiibacteriota bacterium]
MTKKPIILTSLLGICVIFLNLSCCKDCPDCPTYPGEPEPGSYYVFISDGNQDGPGYIWIVDSKTDSLIDSILTPDPRITVMDASCDGQYVATFAQSLGRVLIYDVDMMDTITSLSPSGFPAFTPDGLHLLVFSADQVHKYRISDWSLVASGTMPSPFIPRDLFNNSPYLVSESPDGKAYCIYDYEQMATVKSDSIVR